MSKLQEGRKYSLLQYRLPFVKTYHFLNLIEEGFNQKFH